MTKLLGLFAIALTVPAAALAQRGNDGQNQDRGRRDAGNSHVEARGGSRGNDQRGGSDRGRTYQQHSQQSDGARPEYRDRSAGRVTSHVDTRYNSGYDRGDQRQPAYRVGDNRGNDRPGSNAHNRVDTRYRVDSRVHVDDRYRVNDSYRYRPSPGYRVGYGWHGGFSRDYIGPRHVWRLEGGGRDRFFFRGFYFRVVAYDYVNANDWYWDSDNVIIYDDPDNSGCYLAYNTRLGTYLHVTFDGD